MNTTITEYLSQPTPALAVTSAVTVTNIMSTLPVIINVLTALYLVFLVVKQLEEYLDRRKKRKMEENAPS